MSRIWEALKQAERQRANAASAGHSARRGERPTGPTDRRGKLRDPHNVPLLVYGSDAEKQPFHEEATTINANAHGCLFALESAVSCGQRLFLTNTLNQAEQECRVIHVGRRARGKARVGVEFSRPVPHFWRPE